MLDTKKQIWVSDMIKGKDILCEKSILFTIIHDQQIWIEELGIETHALVRNHKEIGGIPDHDQHWAQLVLQ